MFILATIDFNGRRSLPCGAVEEQPRREIGPQLESENECSMELLDYLFKQYVHYRVRVEELRY